MVRAAALATALTVAACSGDSERQIALENAESEIVRLRLQAETQRLELHGLQQRVDELEREQEQRQLLAD